jgi:hypothetical protein
MMKAEVNGQEQDRSAVRPFGCSLRTAELPYGRTVERTFVICLLPAARCSRKNLAPWRLVISD